MKIGIGSYTSGNTITGSIVLSYHDLWPSIFSKVEIVLRGWQVIAIVEYKVGGSNLVEKTMYRAKGNKSGHNFFSARKRANPLAWKFCKRITFNSQQELEEMANKWMILYASRLMDKTILS